MDSRLNKNGGTLIFTTHYPELLDEYDRNDGICIVRNRKNEELKRELKELFKTLDQMNQSLNRMIDHYILCKTEKAG